MGLMTELASSHNLMPTVAIGNAAFAQEAISTADVQNYARSVLRIEPIRQSAYDEIKRITGADVPSIACHRPNSLDNLSRNIREIAVNYCNQSIQIVESNSLTIGRFNAITAALQSDPDLAARIQQALIRLQEAGNL